MPSLSWWFPDSPHAGALVGAIGLRRAIQYPRMFVEVLPRGLFDVEGEPLQHVAHVGRLVDDALAYESLHDAILVAEDVGFRLLGHVEPKNLLFVFGETTELLRSELREFAALHGMARP